MRRSFATRPIEKRSQLPPLLGSKLIGEQQYVAWPWTCSKVEPGPERADQGPRPERPRAGIPFRYDTPSALGHDHRMRRRGRPPHDAMRDDHEDCEHPKRRGPPD